MTADTVERLNQLALIGAEIEPTLVQDLTNDDVPHLSLSVLFRIDSLLLHNNISLDDGFKKAVSKSKQKIALELAQLWLSESLTVITTKNRNKIAVKKVLESCPTDERLLNELSPYLRVMVKKRANAIKNLDT